jgi:hypothetical protein
VGQGLGVKVDAATQTFAGRAGKGHFGKGQKTSGSGGARQRAAQEHRGQENCAQVRNIRSKASRAKRGGSGRKAPKAGRGNVGAVAISPLQTMHAKNAAVVQFPPNAAAIIKQINQIAAGSTVDCGSSLAWVHGGSASEPAVSMWLSPDQAALIRSEGLTK